MKQKERMMLTRRFKISAGFLLSNALLALTVGCQSFRASDDTVAYSARNEPRIAESHEVRSRTDSFYGRPQAAEPRTPLHAEPSPAPSDDRTTGTRTATAENDSSTAAEQHDRVTIVNSKEPPPTRVETPSHEPRDGEFWVAGIWRGESGDYLWQDGRIEQDRGGQLYVPANWAPSSRGWEYTPEFWR